MRLFLIKKIDVSLFSRGLFEIVSTLKIKKQLISWNKITFTYLYILIRNLT
jgi:hypothetical protein